MIRSIPFNTPTLSEKGFSYIGDAVKINKRLNGDGPFTRMCTEWFEERLSTKVLLTTSCTHALEMASVLSDIQPGDEVIMPSFTFVSTANPFVIRGAKVVFVDIRPDTMNIDEDFIECAITNKTKAIVPVHYAGVSCEMDKILDIAHRHNLLVIEDAAQGMMSRYKDRDLGTMGDFGAYSFHETKNYTMGEGGLCLINNEAYTARAEIIREKGTNRSQFFRGEVDKYSWVDVGSSYLPSEMNAAYLYAQLEFAEEINKKRLSLWERYYNGLRALKDDGYIELPHVPEGCVHNAHMFYIKVRDLDERTKLIAFLKDRGIGAVFHYVPLHSSIAGRKFGIFCGEDVYTTKESERLLRLPMFHDLTLEDVDYVVKEIASFFGVKF
ncbi:MAG: dTDP-4-amino-4,6-dideoxygalactose transaminase [Eubacterium sp.]|nr:dTDP-4-amino-4,6-dideoxygalactose transaminase [Eubacterium sp.]